jgi:pimeloyl-ACP methyl ester carboxylesterase
MTPIAVHPEGPRYARPLVFVSGLWTPATMLRPFASSLAHRGWAGTIADAGGRGGVAERAVDVVDLAGRLEAPPIVIGHDAGGLIALEAARRTTLAAVVWLAPIPARPRELTRLLGTWRVAAAVLRGRDLGTPRGPAALALFGDAAPVGLAARESVALVRDVLRGEAPVPPSLPLALVAAARDPLAGRVSVPGADVLALDVGGRWLLGAEAWQATAGAVHRWLVQRLGAANLDLYEEAMAEREDGE